MLRVIFASLLLFTGFVSVQAAIDPIALLAGVKKKYDLVNNYSAVAQLKTNVLFIKAPISLVTIYYRKPDQLKIKNQKGISLTFLYMVLFDFKLALTPALDSVVLIKLVYQLLE